MTLQVEQPGLLTRDRVIRQLRQLLRDRQYRTGEAMPSERNLAKEFGVSRDTVRSAIQELVRLGLVAPKRARVRSATTGAALNQTAGVLSKTIAFLSHSTVTPDSYSTPVRGHSGEVFAAAGLAIRDAGFHVLSLVANSVTEGDILNLTEQKLGGFIVLGYVTDSEAGRKTTDIAANAGVPLVVNGDGAMLSHLDRVWSDHEAGSYELTRLLLSKGRQRIQRVWRVEADLDWVKARNRGYERAFGEAGLTPLPPIYVPTFVNSDKLRDDFDRAVKTVAGYLIEPMSGAKQADAFMVASDPNAYELATSIQLLGRASSDFPIVGYDNTWQTLECRKWAPSGPIATCDKDNAAVGRAMAQLVLGRNRNALPPEPQRRLVKPGLIDLSAGTA